MSFAEIATLLRELGGWGVAGLACYVAKRLYEDKEAAAKAYAAEKAEDFKLILKVSEDMSAVLATHTETSRDLGGTLRELRERFLQYSKAGAGSTNLLPRGAENGTSNNGG